MAFVLMYWMSTLQVLRSVSIMFLEVLRLAQLIGVPLLTVAQVRMSAYYLIVPITEMSVWHVHMRQYCGTAMATSPPSCKHTRRGACYVGAPQRRPPPPPSVRRHDGAAGVAAPAGRVATPAA